MGTSQKQAARKFVEYWRFRRGSEKGEDQQFWNSLLRDILGVADVEQCIKYQVPVAMGGPRLSRPNDDGRDKRVPPATTKYLDAWIPETRVLIEHKSRGVNLDAPQSGHGGLTPYEQAAEYDNARPFDEKARWIVTCNFDEFRIYDRAKPLAPPLILKLGNLPKEAHRLAFLVNPKEKAVDRELEISVQAGRIVGEIYDALLGQYRCGDAVPASCDGEDAVATSNYLAALNRLCVRLVFCLYAEDADIFPKDCFRRLLEATPAPFLRERLKKLFEILDTPLDKRDVYLEPELAIFPYTNGGLFKLWNYGNAELCNGGNAALHIEEGANPAPDNSALSDEAIAKPRSRQARPSHNRVNLAFFGRDALVASANCRGFAIASDGKLHHSTIPQYPTPDDIPPVSEEIRQLLIGASRFDWRDITPTIFGALFESTLNPVTRRSGGMVYTSVENIHKVIDPLFLGALTERLNEILGMRTEDVGQKTEDVGQGTVGQSSVLRPLSSVLRKKLLALQDELASLTFLDPACGSGNFLTETYICLRRLENRIIAALQQGQGELDLDGSRQDGGFHSHGAPDWERRRPGGGNRVKVSIAQFYGIEINDFAARVARIALWIAEAQMRRETAEILHREPDYLPLHDYDNIIEGNALRLDWGSLLATKNTKNTKEDGELCESVCSLWQKRYFDYVIGNPPFCGARWMGREQKADVLDVFGKGWQGVGDLDYVCCWYKKAMDLTGGSRSRATAGRAACPQAAEDAQERVPPVRCAFVSTNSICQGGAVANLWKPLFAQGLEIDFAHRTFRWDNEAFDKAHVHCVIVGFHAKDNVATASSPSCDAGDGIATSKFIFDGGRAIPAAHINGYLMDAPDVFIEKRSRPLCAVPEIFLGGQPIDDGNLTLTEEEKNDLLARHPNVAPLLRPFMMGRDFINRKPRWCLWLKGADISLVRSCPEIMERIRRVREFRLASRRESTLRAAATPALFGAPVELAGHYIALPKVSSENRRYIPIDYLPPEIIPGDKLFVMPNATLFHFGVMTSIVHMLWNAAVGGRLKSDFSYSNTIVYNNFPWPAGGAAGNSGTAADAASSGKSGDAGGAFARISATAQAILDARAKYPNATLADLYDPDAMHLAPDLLAAHEANDRAVLEAYGLVDARERVPPESEIVARLFKLYAEIAK